MSASIDVSLGRRVKAHWPDACVCCGVDGVHPSVRFSSAPIGWLSTLTMSFVGKRQAVFVPACQACTPRIVWRRRLRSVMELAAIAAVFGLLSLTGQSKKMPGWLFLAFALLPLVPIALIRVFYAPVFDITVTKDKIDYEFRSGEYAQRFYEANR